jgi:RND family efflux transporter MFP subunit
MTRALRDDLASLRIERRDKPSIVRSSGPRPRRAGRNWASALSTLATIALVAGLGIIGYEQYDRYKPAPLVVVAQSQRMSKAEAEMVLSAKGYVKARAQALIGVKASGRVEQVLVDEGQKVKKGDLIAVLEHGDIEAVLDARRATLERTKAQIQEANATLLEKEHRAERARKLLDSRHISAEDLDRDLTELEVARAKLFALEADLKLVEAQIRESQESLNNMFIHAPFDGVVLSKDADVGETITPGSLADAGRGSVATIADLDRVDIEADVTEGLLGKLSIGQAAEATVDAVPDRRYHGKVSKVVPLGDRTRGTVKVKVAIEDCDGRLFPDLVSTVYFLPDRNRSRSQSDDFMIYIPKSAVVSRGGETFVWVYRDEGTVTKRFVEVEPAKGDSARVLKGIDAGVSIVVDPPSTLKENDRVRTQ